MFLLIIVGTWSCERDDICAESTPTTPHLIIRFYSNAEPALFKPVIRLKVRALDADNNPLEDIPVFQSRDSIVLPLRFKNQGDIAVSRFSIENDTDEDETTAANIDIITVTYTPEFQYISRACGYKSIFTNVSFGVQPDDENWILTNEILTTTIDNENQAHIILRH